MNFKDQVVVITGASSGIGEALVIEFAGQGARVVAAARNTAKLQQMQTSLHQKGQHMLAVATDVSRETDCQNLIQAAIDKYGKIDVIINNAGISMRALFQDVDIDVLKQVMDVNFWGTAYCSKYALPHLQASQGSLVAVSSVAGYKGLPGRTGYSASKFAIQGLMEVIRIENLHTNVHVLIACPGFTSSNIRNVALAADGSRQGESPLNENKLMSATTVAHKIARAIYKRKNNIILTAQGKAIVYLNKFVPHFLNKMVFRHFLHEPNSPLK
ncbi:MAG: SDR family oxidoreductase [Clostridia bacterium]|nr:SDR family oxidoreductase [Clostridia bacterium]